MLLAIPSGLVMARSEPGSLGKIVFYGSLGVETEDYQYDSAYQTSDRLRFRSRFDLNGRGAIWDPRFALFDAGITLQREKVKSGENDTGGNASYNMLGYRLNTTWFANKPYPLTVYANRNQNTVSDFWSPSYQLTTSNFGARWGMENPWLGRSNFYLDQTHSESSSSLVPRSDQNLSIGLDATQKLWPKKWGESDMSYGYRHTAWDEKVYGGKQRQDYFYFNDRSLFGDKSNLSANLTYYDRSDQFGFSGLGTNLLESKFLGFNGMFTVQQTDDFRHYYNLGLGMNETGGTQNISHNLSGGVNYRFNQRWQATGLVGVSGTNTEMPATAASGAGQNQKSASVSGSAAVMYSDTVADYLLNGGYTLALMQTDTTSTSGLPSQRNSTHTANFGYTRMNSPRYADSLNLRISRTLGETSGHEANIHYGVTSALTQSDMLQGTIEYRRYQQSYPLWSSDLTATEYYATDSQSARLDFGWMHRLSETNSLMFSAGATSSSSQSIVINTRYSQARATFRLRSALLWTALARAEQIEGAEYIAGRKVTVESDVNYQIGKWQAGLRYRLRDAKQEFAPFKEQSLILMLKRDYGFRL